MFRIVSAALAILLSVALPAAAQVREGPYGGVQFSSASGTAMRVGVYQPWFIFCAEGDDVSISGSMTGVTLGFAKARANTLIGFEVQYSAGSVNGSGDGGLYGCGDQDVCIADLKNLTVLRAVIASEPSGKVNPYAAIGLAGANYEGSVQGACPGPYLCGDAFVWGGALAAGAQGPFGNNFFWRAELQWSFLPIGEGISDGYVSSDSFRYWFNTTQLQAGIFLQF